MHQGASVGLEASVLQQWGASVDLDVLLPTEGRTRR
jgi:hypothetical protein